MPPAEHPGLSGLREIGRGGFGVVYRARQDHLDREVALKLLHARPDERRQARFAQECRALGQLSGHPHIVDVHDGGIRQDGSAFLLMAYYGRGALAERLKRDGPLPWPETVDIGIRLAGALQTAHDAGILHRDLKPANVLVDDYGGPRLADFGQARMYDGEQTRTGETAITPGFTAPEVLNGERATAQSDIYALAATVVALLRGRAPFDTGGDLVAMLYKVVSEPPPDLRPAGVPDPVCLVLERALAKDPAQRFPSAEAFGDALIDCQRRAGLPAPPLVVGGRPAAALPPVDVVATDPALAPVPPVGPASGPYLGPAAARGPHPSAPAPAPAAGPLPGHPALLPPSPAAPPPRPAAGRGPRRRGRAGLVTMAALLVLAVVALGVGFLVNERRDDNGGSAAPGGTTTAPQSGESTPAPSSGPEPSPTSTAPSEPPAGTVDVSAVAGDPDADAVGAALSAYFLGVNARDFDAAYAVFSPQLRGRIAFDQWSGGLTTTTDSDVTVVGIEPAADGALRAQTTFTSRQSAEAGPEGQTCTNWTLTYTLVPNVDGPAAWQIDAVQDVGPGNTAC